MFLWALILIFKMILNNLENVENVVKPRDKYVINQ